MGARSAAWLGITTCAFNKSAKNLAGFFMRIPFGPAVDIRGNPPDLFDLTGYDPSASGFSGRWASDNSGYVVFNGATISTGSSFNSWTSFAATIGTSCA